MNETKTVRDKLMQKSILLLRFSYSFDIVVFVIRMIQSVISNNTAQSFLTEFL